MLLEPIYDTEIFTRDPEYHMTKCDSSQQRRRMMFQVGRMRANRPVPLYASR